jgi:SAM-dependent methyltransferase
MAISLPGAQFTGIDLASVPVERGNQVIRDLGLSNVRLLQMDLLGIGEDLGEFDYIIAHGLYAWTPPVVRDKILAIARAHLSPNGIAFISYNAYPGGHLRKVLREAMLLHVGDAADPAVRLDRARCILQLFAAGRPEPDEFDRAFAAEAAEVMKRSQSSLFHDFLADIYEPVQLSEFVAHAAKHRLQYLADASALDSANPKLTAEVLAAVTKSTADRIEREQYLDMLRLRRFRQSLVCRAEVAIQDEWITPRAAGLFAASSAEETAEGQFTGQSGVTAKSNHPAVIAFLRKLIAVWPRAERLSPPEAEMAFKLFRGSMIDLRTTPGIAVRAGERPIASPLARYQAQSGDEEMSTLHHRSLPIGDERARHFLALLDGTRDHATLAREGAIKPEEVEALLGSLGRAAMLVG